VRCDSHCGAIDEFFDRKVATREAEHYRRRGPSAATRRLLSYIREAGIVGARVLDIGGGIGAIPHELLDSGASHATLVDASRESLKAARKEAERRGSPAALAIIHGDFTAIARDVPEADVVTLDKVVCCYPDMDGLLAASTGRARRLFGIVYPRDGFWMRWIIGAQNAFRRVRGVDFRVYIFPERSIDDAIRSAGFSLRDSHRGLVWISALYVRSAD